MALILRHFWQKRWVIIELGISTLFLLFLGFLNTEELIAIYFPPTVNNEIDEVYLSALSADGYKGWQRAYRWAKEISESLLDKQKISLDDSRKIEYAYWISLNLEENYNFGNRKESWRDFNFIDWLVLKRMEEEIPYSEIERLKKDILKIKERINTEIEMIPSIDRAPGRFLK